MSSYYCTVCREHKQDWKLSAITDKAACIDCGADLVLITLGVPDDKYQKVSTELAKMTPADLDGIRSNLKHPEDQKEYDLYKLVTLEIDKHINRLKKLMP